MAGKESWFDETQESYLKNPDVFEEVSKLARYFAVDVFDRGDGEWLFRGMNRSTSYFPDKRSVFLRDSDWQGARGGDYAIAIMVTLTGINPMNDGFQGYVLCDLIRNYKPPQKGA
jgi:hypothetical protein